MTLASASAKSILAEGLEAYRARRYWHAHERWEQLWRRLSPPEKAWVQGLILLAAAAWHLERRREPVTRRLLALAAMRLKHCPGLPRIPDADRLAEHAAACAASATLTVPPVTL